MGNALGVMQQFMSSLDNTSLSGQAALDEAVQACSGFGSIQGVIDSLVQSCASAGNKTSWLQSACGINLTNADTGAITGSDAGGSTTKTASSIVPEGNQERRYSYGTYTKSDWEGLMVTSPDKEELTKAQMHVMSGIWTWWMGEGLKLIKESYGLSFDEAGTTVKKLTITFDPPSDGWGNTLACVNPTETWAGETTELVLHVNMSYFSNMAGSPDGEEDGEYLDRTLAHELTHAVMAANIQNFAELPRFIREGAAELVHGIDDIRGNIINLLAKNPAALRAALNVNNTKGDTTVTYSSDVYAAGYMLLRYLAKQSSTGTTISNWPGTQITYASDNSTLNVGAGYSGTIWLNPQSKVEYNTGVNNIDASAADGNVALIGRGDVSAVIKGGKGTNAMWGGGSSNDVLQGGSGANTFWYGRGDGTDTVTNFHSGTDKINYYAGGFDSITASGSDVVIGAGSGSLDIKDAVGKRLDILVGGVDFRCWFGHNDQANSTVVSGDIDLYVGSSNQQDTLQVTGAASSVVNLQSNRDVWYLGIDVVDASQSTGSTILIGDAASNTLKGGSGTNAMWGGGSASDTMQGGSGADTFWYGHGDGQDTILNGQSIDTIYLYNADRSQVGFSMDGTNLKVSLGGNDTLTVADWTAASGTSKFRFADQSEYQLTTVLNK